MSITVVCECGKSLKARDEDAGKRAKCPNCGVILSIEEALPVLEEAEEPSRDVTIKMGEVDGRFGGTQRSVWVSKDGDSFAVLHVVERDTRRKGEVLLLDPDEIAEFALQAGEAARTIEKMRRLHQIRN